MSTKALRQKPFPKPIHHILSEEKAWLGDILRQLAYDEYMQAQREVWLFERPPKRNRIENPPTILHR